MSNSQNLERRAGSQTGLGLLQSLHYTAVGSITGHPQRSTWILPLPLHSARGAACSLSHTCQVLLRTHRRFIMSTSISLIFFSSSSILPLLYPILTVSVPCSHPSLSEEHFLSFNRIRCSRRPRSLHHARLQASCQPHRSMGHRRWHRTRQHATHESQKTPKGPPGQYPRRQ
jgi:hypothetical protein